MPRIRCHYLDCLYLDEKYCSAAGIELSPDTGCLTYSPNEEGEVKSWEEDEELDDWDEMEGEEEDDDMWSEDEEDDLDTDEEEF